MKIEDVDKGTALSWGWGNVFVFPCTQLLITAQKVVWISRKYNYRILFETSFYYFIDVY